MLGAGIWELAVVRGGIGIGDGVAGAGVENGVGAIITGDKGGYGLPPDLYSGYLQKKMARLTNRERRKKTNRKALLAALCMMRVLNSVIQLYLLITELIAERNRQRVRQKPHLRANPNVYQSQLDALNRNVTVAEKVAIFLWILAHHTKNRRTILQFWRSGETISRHFNAVLIAVIRLHNVLWYHPQPIPANEPDARWKWFEVSISMESEGTSQSEPTSRKRKQDRRLWTFAEEEALLAAMMECICDKYRAHNGFKPGYFNEVEKELKKRLPGTTLKAQPNIESKSNTKAKGLNGKSFPMYESWQFLFGKDRATREMAEDAAEVEEVVETYQDEANIDLDDMFNECYTPTFPNSDTVFPRATPGVDISTSSGTPTSNAIPTATTSNANTARSNAKTPTSNANAPTSNVVPGRPKKKAKVDTNEASIHVAVENILAQSNTAFNKIAEAVGYEGRLSAKREKVFTELMKLDLEMIDRFALNTMIVSAEENVDTFYGIPENYKQAWVEAVLSGQIKLKTT
ncbi:hypothetical protein RHMOL_Rhmol01G0328800 [Rhododendron molle]|nr:hypothetical protein RHMOL_Rhmol01G0328800 [Rhododendron molle]